jgi:receptor expression-enhancing protein 5/6
MRVLVGPKTCIARSVILTHHSASLFLCLLLLYYFEPRYLQDKTKVPKEFLVVGGGFLTCLFVVFGVGVASLSSLVGFLYPAFKSFQAIETKNKGDDTQWLVYWVIFAFFSIIEVFVDILLYWIPFYYAFKLAFLLWAMLPQTKGAKFLYDAFLKDFLKKNESRIDAAMADAKKNAGSIASELSSATSDLVGAAATAASNESKKDE